MSFFDALKIAEDAGLDLVEIAPNSVPPVCKILDYGRFRFLEQKKASEARKKQRTIEIKDGFATVPRVPGLGIEVDEERLAYYVKASG